MIDSGKALLQLINDVLDLSKLEANQMQISFEATDLVELCNENIRLFERTAQEKKLALHTQISVPASLILDKLRVRQILFNLLGNAVKFTQQGSVTLWANFTSEGKDAGTLRFGVTDTGIGIASADQAKLLEPFVQLSKLRGTNAANNGTGLGLPICKRLVERMNGKLSMESEVGKGSTFAVCLPDVKYSAAPPDADSEPSVVTAETINHPSLLLVDDVPMNLLVLRTVMKKLGVTDVACAASGAKALARLNERTFQMVLTDLWMPGMNGAELARAIHKLPQFHDLPVIAVTADVESKGNFPMDDFAAVMLKPITSGKCAEILRLC